MSRTTSFPSISNNSGDPGGRRMRGERRTVLALSALFVACAVAYTTLGPPSVVANVRAALVTMLNALLGSWIGTVHRAPFKAAAKVLLFLPVGALAALALARRSRLLPLLPGAGLSVSLELAQSLLPGRVPDLVDVAANTAGTALGVGLVVVAGVLVRSRRRRSRGRRLLCVGVLTVVALAALAACRSTMQVSHLPSSMTAPAASVTTSAVVRLTAADGWMPDGQSVSPFADVPAISNLDPALRQAMQNAARDAISEGLKFHVSSGWRSVAYQNELLNAAVAQYGSAEAAAKFVLPANKSAHAAGRAVDIGPTDAMSWMAKRGSDYGLCQTYGNEAWHFELSVNRGGICPAPAPDASGG